MSEQPNLRFWREELKGEVPEKSIIIGSDVGGGFVLLCKEEGMEGVYYYDHSYLFPMSSDEENTYFICATFADFFSQLDRHSVKIEVLSKHTTDFINADNSAPLGPKLPENTWFRQEETETMEEIDKIVHSRFTHRGSVSAKKMGQ